MVSKLWEVRADKSRFKSSRMAEIENQTTDRSRFDRSSGRVGEWDSRLMEDGGVD